MTLCYYFLYLLQSFIQVDEKQTFLRDCVPPILKSMVCDSEESNSMYKDVKCCDKHLCNTGSCTVATSVVALISALVLCLAFQ